MTGEDDRLSDPKVFGPGMWSSIHIYAAEATTPERKNCFIDFITVLFSNLKCLNCRQHATAYLERHPPRDVIDEPDGLFRWTWMMHNVVNRRLGKPELSFEEASKLFLNGDEGVCAVNCGDPIVTGTTVYGQPRSASQAATTSVLPMKNSSYLVTQVPTGGRRLRINRR